MRDTYVYMAHAFSVYVYAYVGLVNRHQINNTVFCDIFYYVLSFKF